MPRDLTREAEIQTKPDLSKPSLEGLAWLLRHPEEWPTGYEWDMSTTGFYYDFERGCAMCLWKRVWGELVFSHNWGDAGDSMFMQTGAKVSPRIVASRIDDYLAGRPIRYLVEGDRS